VGNLHAGSGVPDNQVCRLNRMDANGHVPVSDRHPFSSTDYQLQTWMQPRMQTLSRRQGHCRLKLKNTVAVPKNERKPAKNTVFCSHETSDFDHSSPLV
jgi:hypothetical protein